MAGKKKKRFPWFAAIIIVAAVVVIGLLVVNAPRLPGTSKLFFFKDGKLGFVCREIPEKADIYYFTANELIKGPTTAEKSSGYYSQIPKGTKILTLSRSQGTLKADFSRELQMCGGGTAKVEAILSQIVRTFTDLPGINNVQILVEGKKEVVLGSEGFIIDKPLSRKDVTK